MMGVRTILPTSCKNRRSALYSSLAGQARIIFEPLSSYGVFPIGMTRPFSCKIPHLLSSSHGRKGILLIPWRLRAENSINGAGYLSCKSSSSSFLRFSSIPESVVEVSECGVILSGRDCCKDESHFEPFIPLPCHLKEDFVLTGLIDNRIKTNITDKILLSGESFHRVSNLCDYSCYSDFTESWDGKEDVVRVVGIHNLLYPPFQLLNLEIELKNSLSSPLYLVSENREKFSLEKAYKFSEGTGGRDIFKIRVGREELEEISTDFLTYTDFITRGNYSEVFSEAIYTSCSFIEESSSESCNGAKGELMGRERGRGPGWESFKVSGNYLSINFIGFGEDEVSFSKFIDAVRIDESDFKSSGSSFHEEVIEGEMEVSSGFHADYNRSSLSDEAGEGEGISSKESEAIRGIGVFSLGSYSFPLMVQKASGKSCLTNIHADKKGFSHDRTSFFYFECLVDPLLSDGNYPPGLRAQGTSCNQISPSECGEPSSLPCSRHIKNEGLPDTLTFYFIPLLNLRSKISCI